MASGSGMVYKFREGARLKSFANAQAIGEEIEKLSANNRAFGPKLVVEKARDPKNVMHPQFDWDDRVAGKQWRLKQAGDLIRAVTIVYADEDESEEKGPNLRAFVAVEENDERGSYVPMGRALSVPKYRDRLMLEAEKELSWYTDKYKMLKNIKDYWNPLQLSKKALEKRTKEIEAKLEGKVSGSKKKKIKGKVAK